MAGVNACGSHAEGEDLPVESSSRSKALERLSLSPSMNSNPCEETNSSTSWSPSEGVVVIMTELSLSAENWMASLISGSNELIAPMNLSTCSLYGYGTGECKYMGENEDKERTRPRFHTNNTAGTPPNSFRLGKYWSIVTLSK